MAWPTEFLRERHERISRADRHTDAANLAHRKVDEHAKKIHDAIDKATRDTHDEIDRRHHA